MSGINGLFQGMNISASAMKAERARVDIIAKNIAHSGTTKMPDTGEPYRREIVQFAPVYRRNAEGGLDVDGVQVSQISKDYTTPFELINDPTHPDADANGNVRMPNVNTVKEMAEMITAMRAYESNVQVAETFERMAQAGLRLAE
jgi:flagellar basal-body rod protein FlgC